MKIRQKYKNLIIFLLSFMLMVCALPYEPISVTENTQSSQQSSFAEACAYKKSCAEPESFIDKNEQVITVSLKTAAGRHHSGGRYFSNRDCVVEKFDLNLLFGLSMAAIVRYESGASILFRNILAYIWSQIGL